MTISTNEFAAMTGVDSILTESTQFSSKKMATTKKNENIKSNYPVRNVELGKPNKKGMLRVSLLT